MRLVRGAWKVLVGVKDALVLILMLIFFGLLYMALTSRPNAKAVGSGALVLNLKGSIVEQPQVASPSELIGGSAPLNQYRLSDLIRGLDAAADDDRVKLVVLDLDGFTGGGQVGLSDVGAAIDRVRGKKKVYAYATGYSDSSYQIAAHASEIWLDPMGLALFQGPGGSRLYYKGLIDKLGINAHVYRVGKYKSFVEPYTRADQSPEAKAASEALAASLWQGWQADVLKARPHAKLAAYIADPVHALASGDLAKGALAAGLVDKLGGREAFDRMIMAQVGVGKHKTDFAKIDLAPWIAAHPSVRKGDIGIVTVAGNIVDGQADPGTAGGDTITRIIDQAVASGDFKALVLRVDSPGGSALASEKIRLALLQAKAKGMPIVVSMGNVAASGGYWVSTAGDRVFAEPTTITGSIGVFGIIPTFESALAKIGVTSDGIKTTPLSGQPDIVGGTNAAFDTIIQKSIESTYGKFLMLVSGARRIPVEKVNEIAQGRVWDGGTARQLGLVDGFGGINDAVLEAARLAKLDPPSVKAVYLEKPPTFAQSVAAMLTGDNDDDTQQATDLLSTLTRERMAMAGTAVADARSLATGSAIQVRCLDCPSVAAPVQQRSLMQMFLAWIAK